MAELTLTRDERLALKAAAHHLNPVVLLGAAGLSDAVVKEIDRALNAHELIKIRVPGDDRDEREAIFADLAERLSAARVQSIGKLLVLYRPTPEELKPEAKAEPKARPKARADRKPEKPPRARPAARDAAKPARARSGSVPAARGARAAPAARRPAKKAPRSR